MESLYYVFFQNCSLSDRNTFYQMHLINSDIVHSSLLKTTKTLLNTKTFSTEPMIVCSKCFRLIVLRCFSISMSTQTNVRTIDIIIIVLLTSYCRCLKLRS